MATQLFKDGQSSFFEANRVQGAIQAGWSPVDPGVGAPKHPEVIFPAGMNLEKLPMEEAEAIVLKAMGINPLKAIETVTANPEVREAVEIPKPKRKYIRRK